MSAWRCISDIHAAISIGIDAKTSGHKLTQELDRRIMRPIRDNERSGRIRRIFRKCNGRFARDNGHVRQIKRTAFCREVAHSRAVQMARCSEERIPAIYEAI